MNIKSNKTWLEHEKYQIWLAYHAKAPQHVMAEYFDRTKTSLNKYLSRSGIRTKKDDNMSIIKTSCKISTLEDLTELIIACGLDIETVGLERNQTRNWQPSQYTMDALEKYGLKIPESWKIPVKSDQLPKKSGVGCQVVGKDTRIVPFEVTVNYLKRHNYKIAPYTSGNNFQWTYKMNNRPVTDSALLAAANMLRIKNNEPIFLVQGVTFDL